MSNFRRTDEQPHDRLTELAGVMVAALESEEGADDVQAIVLLTDGDQAGATIHGYEDEGVMLSHLVSHMEAIFTAYGLSFSVTTVDPEMN